MGDEVLWSVVEIPHRGAQRMLGGGNLDIRSEGWYDVKVNGLMLNIIPTYVSHGLFGICIPADSCVGNGKLFAILFAVKST